MSGDAWPERCPLCLARSPRDFGFDRQRIYLRCRICRLIFVPPRYFPSAGAEKAEYDLHQNSPGDERYRSFLSRLFLPVQEHVRRGSNGLDFGSGPGPTLSLMFQEAGHRVQVYDKFYAPNPAVLQQTYDFITASEVVEHLHEPNRELEQLWTILRRGGVLGIMTKMALDWDAFSRWHYKNDQTHVCFYSTETFVWLGRKWKADVTFVGKDVVLLKKG